MRRDGRASEFARVDAAVHVQGGLVARRVRGLVRDLDGHERPATATLVNLVAFGQMQAEDVEFAKYLMGFGDGGEAVPVDLAGWRDEAGRAWDATDADGVASAARTAI